MFDPILVTLSKRQPLYSQSSHEIATPSSGTSLFAHYRKVGVASLGGHNILPKLIFHQAFIKLHHTNIEKT